MNPLRWPGERLAALAALCAAGGILGVVFAWFQSPFYRIGAGTVSGPWANSTANFLWWLPAAGMWWPWASIGAVLAGLLAYAGLVLSTGNRK